MMYVAHGVQNLAADIQNYRRVMDSISDKAQELSKTSSDPRLTDNMTRMTQRYTELAQLATVRLLCCPLNLSLIRDMWNCGTGGGALRFETEIYWPT